MKVVIQSFFFFFLIKMKIIWFHNYYFFLHFKLHQINFTFITGHMKCANLTERDGGGDGESWPSTKRLFVLILARTTREYRPCIMSIFYPNSFVYIYTFFSPRRTPRWIGLTECFADEWKRSFLGYPGCLMPCGGGNAVYNLIPTAPETVCARIYTSLKTLGFWGRSLFEKFYELNSFIFNVLRKQFSNND